MHCKLKLTIVIDSGPALLPWNKGGPYALSLTPNVQQFLSVKNV